MKVFNKAYKDYLTDKANRSIENIEHLLNVEKGSLGRFERETTHGIIRKAFDDLLAEEADRKEKESLENARMYFGDFN